MEENKEKKIYLPKNVKHLNWNVWREISIFDLAFFIIFAFIGSIGILAGADWSIKAPLMAIFWLIAIIGVLPHGDGKTWELFLSFLNYLFLRKKIKLKELRSIEKYTEVQGNEYVTKIDNTYVYALSLNSFDFATLNYQQREQKINEFGSFLKKMQTIDIKIYKTNKNRIYENQKAEIKKLKLNNKKNAPFITTLNYQSDIINQLETSKDGKYPFIYMIFQFNSENQAINKSEWIYNQASKFLIVSKVKNNELKRLLLTKEKYKTDITIKSTHILANKRKYKFYSVYEYPTLANYCWLRPLLEINELEAFIDINPMNKIMATKFLKKAKTKNEISSNKSWANEFDEAEYQETIETMMAQVRTGTDVLQELNILFYADITNKKDEIHLKNELDGLKADGFRMNSLTFKQYEALTSSFITHTNLIKKKSSIAYTTENIASSYFFNSKGLSDEKGLLLGYTQWNELPIVFDWFKRNKSENRLSGNTLILGRTGSGKTFLTKKLIMQAGIKGAKVYIFDPENEYGNLIKKIGGEIIKIGTKNNNINPLQIFDEDEEGNALLKHLSFIKRILYFIQPNIKKNTILVYHIINIFKLTYKKFSIDQEANFTKINNNKWPTFSDAQLLAKKYITKKTIKTKLTTREIEEIKIIFEDLTTGTHSYFLNKKTTIDFNNNLVAFELLDMFKGENKELKDMIMFILLQYASGQAIRNYEYNTKNNKDQKLVILVDEAHEFISDENRIALNFLYSWTKRIRKYRGQVVITTQDIKDFSTEKSDGRYSSGILNNMQYIFYGTLEEDNLNSLIEMHKNTGGINEEVIKAIKNASTGEFYMRTTRNQSYLINVAALPHEEELFQK